MKDIDKTKGQLVREIVNLHQERNKLSKESDYLENIIETSLCSIVITDTEGRISRVNEAFLKMVGYKKDEIIGKFMVENAPREPGVYETTLAEKYEIDESFFNKTRKMVEDLFEFGKVLNFEGAALRKDGKLVLTEENNSLIYNKQNEVVAAASILLDVTKRKQVEKEKEKLILDLQKALDEVKTLSGLLPICASCKNIRDDKGYWNKIEFYIKSHSGVDFTHSICPECAKKLYPELYEDE